MKPHVTMHMATSIDGRIQTIHWPQGFNLNQVYEQIHRELVGDAWFVGSVTMAEFAQGDPVAVAGRIPVFPRATWKAPGSGNGCYAVYVDRKGALHLNRDRVNGDALVAVLTTQVADSYLAELRRDGISYLFAGDDDIDLALALDTLHSEFDIHHLLLEGGGGINGAFLDAGLIDEVSLLVLPFADGRQGAPTLFDRSAGAVPVMELVSVSQLERDVLHLRYRM